MDFGHESISYNFLFGVIMGLSVWQIVIIFIIVVLLFGTRRLRSFGSDLGESIQGFKRAMTDTKQGKLDSDVSSLCLSETSLNAADNKAIITSDNYP